VLYAAHARQLATGSVRFLPVKAAAGPLSMTTSVAVRRDVAVADRLRPLFEACRAAGSDDRDS
jgi:hypothetical protein